MMYTTILTDTLHTERWKFAESN